MPLAAAHRSDGDVLVDGVCINLNPAGSTGEKVLS